MAQDAVSICNLALNRINATQVITSLDGSTDESLACRRAYEHSLRKLLEERPWPFAQRFVQLMELSDVEPIGWEYYYVLPPDCLLVRGIFVGVPLEKEYRSERAEYAIGFEGNRKVLKSNIHNPVIAYTALHEIPEIYPPSFVDALIWLVASELAMSLATKSNYEEKCRVRYEGALSKATALALSEPEIGADPESQTITTRHQ
jgi:hypothetical protein